MRGVRRLPRNVYVLSWVSFFQDAASELLYPVIPLFVTSVLGAPPSILGLIEGVAEGTAAAGKAVSGRLADRFRRKPLIGIGYGISSVAKPIIGLAGGWPLVLVARFTDRVGKGMRTSPRDALLAADVPAELRGAAFGFHRAADTAGAVVGPLLGLALYEALDHHLRPLFFVAAGPALISVALIRFVHEAPAAPVPARAAEDALAPPREPLPRAYWKVVGFLALFGLANFSDAFVILRAKDLGLGFVSIVLVYALYNACYAGLSYPAGAVSDRMPRRLVFAGGLAFFAIAYVGLGLAGSGGWVWLFLPIYGAYTALTDGVGKAWVADLLPRGAYGSGLGYYQAITGGCALLAGVWAGLAWGHGGRTPMLVSGIAVAALAVVLALFGRRLAADA
ncbi:MAG TPA: MFS transporter [Solirubrobacteraceae bacterium]|nr:MFS transporter [Solirubrobacteraceae bacterium]